VGSGAWNLAAPLVNQLRFGAFELLRVSDAINFAHVCHL